MLPRDYLHTNLSRCCRCCCCCSLLPRGDSRRDAKSGQHSKSLFPGAAAEIKNKRDTARAELLECVVCSTRQVPNKSVKVRFRFSQRRDTLDLKGCRRKGSARGRMIAAGRVTCCPSLLNLEAPAVARGGLCGRLRRVVSASRHGGYLRELLFFSFFF